jgi:hypothetical protein
MKSIWIKYCIGMWLALAFGAVSAAADIVVIANSGVKIPATEVRDVFLGEKQFADSIKLVPVDNSALQTEFLAKVIKMEAGKYSTAWTKKAFRDGLAAPAVKSGDAEVIEFVKRTPGAVGYVSSSPAGVNVVGSF